MTYEFDAIMALVDPTTLEAHIPGHLKGEPVLLNVFMKTDTVSFNVFETVTGRGWGRVCWCDDLKRRPTYDGTLHGKHIFMRRAMNKRGILKYFEVSEQN